MKNVKYIFVINPKAGNGKSIETFQNILSFARNENKDEVDNFIWFYTDKNGEVKDAISHYSKQYPDATIYTVGGDGTLNEVINSVDSTAKIGIIPAGSGNDFYRVSKNINGDKKINLGVVNGHKFINIASLGFDARVANKANNLKNKNKKILVYPRAILNTLKDNKPIEYNLNGVENKSTVFVVGNGKYYGNGVPINPIYDLSSNYLNIISAPAFNRRQIMKFLLKVLKEKHIDDPMICHYFIKELDIISNEELLCNVDGEIITSKEFNFKIIEDGVTITNNHPQYVKKAINLIK